VHTIPWAVNLSLQFLYGTSTICRTILIDLRQTLLYSPSSAECYAIQATYVAIEVYRTAVAVLSSYLHMCKSWIHLTTSYCI